MKKWWGFNMYVQTGLANYYGYVELQKIEDKYFLTLENYDGDYGVEVSEEFALAMQKEFENKERKVVRV